MEESFEKTKGILEAISGYSGGITENPTYKEVTYGNTGHFETVKIIYDSEIISYRKILEVYWKNINPFDSGFLFTSLSNILIVTSSGTKWPLSI